MNKNFIKVLEFIKSQQRVSYSQIINKFSDLNETTIIRNLNKLIESEKIIKDKDGKNTYYRLFGNEFIVDYFQKPFFERESKTYNVFFLEKYEPNKTNFLGSGIEKLNNMVVNTLSTYDYMHNIRGIENLLIDLSYASSMLEGNTYSYLDTEVLIKYNKSAEGKTKFETQMILNHKNAINYVIENRNKIKYIPSEFRNLHLLLGKGLLTTDYLGVIRSGEVQIGGSAYKPLDKKPQLENQFQNFLKKLNKIKNPFEQSFFILVFIPYFQLFMDINKRVSRISANIPLIKNGLPPFSFLKVDNRNYINAILAIYELNDISLLKNLYIENYIENIDRYKKQLL